MDTVVLDTTVQPKAIAHPPDSRLLNKAREHQAGRFAHAKQYRRMQREIRKLRTWLGRVIRDLQRTGGEIPAQDGINDRSCVAKVRSQLLARGYPEMAPFMLEGGARSADAHYWLDDYNLPLLTFFASRLR